MSVRITMIANKARRWLAVDGNIWHRIVPEAMHRTADAASSINRELTPRGETGNLQESFWWRIEEVKRLRMGWDAPYAEAVDEGVSGGPGRFVPQIGEKGKRLIEASRKNPDIGEWPGFEGRHFIDEVIAEVKRAMFDNLMEELERRWIR